MTRSAVLAPVCAVRVRASGVRSGGDEAGDGILLISGDELIEMRERPDDSEDVLQELLARSPGPPGR